MLQIQATQNAFAAILEDGSVVTWGDADFGGNSSEVRDQLKGVQQIQATALGAFAAILEDGSVVTWGYVDSGGDSKLCGGASQMRIPTFASSLTWTMPAWAVEHELRIV